MEIAIPILTAILGFLGGLLTPWVKRKMKAAQELDASRRVRIAEWRAVIDSANFNDQRHIKEFGNSPMYSSLRSHLNKDVISKFEKDNTFFVGGGRGDDVRKYLLLDEIARLEKLWKLL